VNQDRPDLLKNRVFSLERERAVDREMARSEFLETL